MQILTGLFDHMVLQRASNNRSCALIEGRCDGEGTIVARVRSGGKQIKLAQSTLGRVVKGRFEGELKGIPAGGPYDIELHLAGKAGQANESLTVRDVLVGDVWLLGGQSNMQGCGRAVDAAKPQPSVRAFYMTDTWGVAKDPLHAVWDAVDPIHASITPPEHSRAWQTHNGVGPGVAFAQELARITGVPQGLIACAHGGTTMTQWDPALKKLGGDSLYGAMIRRLRKNGGRVAGLAWYQGESDCNEAAAHLYTDRMKKFIRALRRDAGDPALPVAAVQLGRTINGWREQFWNSVQHQQALLPKVIRNVTIVPAIDLNLDDGIHISGKDQQRLGRRLARAMGRLKGWLREAKGDISLKRVEVKSNPVMNGAGDVVVEFDNVVGSLQAAHRVTGFSLTSNEPLPIIYDVKVQANKVILHTNQAASSLEDKMLHYGFGINPFCNVVDAADRALPVFGPIALGKPRAFTPFVNQIKVSQRLPGAGNLEKLSFPDLSQLKFEPRSFGATFCDLHLDPGASAAEDTLVYFLCTLDCPEPMKLNLGVGYDGPVKMWVDGKLKYHDPNGINPSRPDKGLVPFKASAGNHQVLIALGSNLGRAWGIFFRAERLDIPLRLIKQGPTAYTLPTIL